jgi:hypothetical protein
MERVMKDDPFDRFASVLFWPMEQARRVRNRWLKLSLILLYFPWFFTCLPVAVPLLFVSITMAVWDDVNGR